MDLRIVHPVPLAVDDVVADLHVLEDLRRAPSETVPSPITPRNSGNAGISGRLAKISDAAAERHAALDLDHAADVAAIAVAEARLDLALDRVELAAEVLDLRRRRGETGS